MLCLAQRVAGDRLLQANQGDNIAGVSLGQILAIVRVGEDVIELADQFLGVASGVPDAGIRLERPRINAHVKQLAMRIGNDLEHQPAERFFGIGSALFLLILIRGVHCSLRRRSGFAGM